MKGFIKKKKKKIWHCAQNQLSRQKRWSEWLGLNLCQAVEEVFSHKACKCKGCVVINLLYFILALTFKPAAHAGPGQDAAQQRWPSTECFGVPLKMSIISFTQRALSVIKEEPEVMTTAPSGRGQRKMTMRRGGGRRDNKQDSRRLSSPWNRHTRWQTAEWQQKM